MTRRDRTELAAMLGVPESELGDYVPRFNIAPTQPYFVLKTKYESREAIPATWGLVNSWAKDASRASMCINAKAETVDKLPSFREAFEKRRCVVPADGFYEWVRREVACVIVRRYHPTEPAVPSAVSYEEGRIGNESSKSPRTMYPSVARRVSVPRGKGISASIEAERG
jgi:SOS response associated peptidase (SRAP)